jgi:hypothetical protein
MTLELPRRGFLLGLGALITAPAIVQISSLMPIRALSPYLDLSLITDYDIEGCVTQLDVLYGYVTIMPNWGISLNDLYPRH